MTDVVGNSLCEVLIGSYELKVQNYSKLDKTVGSPIWSPIINLVGRQWKLKIYLGGYTEEAKDCISMFLHNEQRNSEVKATVAFTLLNQVKQELTHRHTMIKSFAPPRLLANRGWGYSKFVRRSLLIDENTPFIVNDTAIFQVEITLTNNANSSYLHTITEAQSNTQPFLNNLFQSGLGSDVSVVILDIDSQHVGDRIPAHKGILMVRSPVFKAMFTHNMSESNTNEIVISDFSPVVVREMLHFMYTDELQSEALDNTVYEGLLGAAIKYDVSELAELCEAYFCKQLADDSVIDLYQLANATGSEVLKKKCVSYVKNNAERLVKSNISDTLYCSELNAICKTDVDNAEIRMKVQSANGRVGDKVRSDGSRTRHMGCIVI